MFQSPDWLFLLILIPIMVLILFWRELIRQSMLRRIGDERLVRILTNRVSATRRTIRITLWFGCLTLLIVALAGPTFGTTVEVQPNLGNRLILIVDTSRSMNVRDMGTSRLERLKIDLSTIVERFAGNEYAIVAFARDAFLYMPFTVDIAAAQVFISGITTEMLSQQGTDLGNAIELSLGLMNDRPDIPTTILLLTDGEDHEPLAVTVAQIAREREIKIHVLGYGTISGGPVPLYDIGGNLIGYKSLNDGTLVNSARNDSLLNQIASTTGGIYIGMDQVDGITRIFFVLEDLVEGELGDRIIQKPQNIASLFILGSLILLSSEIVLSNSGRRPA